MKGRISIQQGDITQMETDAVVNAANKFLAPGGGVAGAIHQEAGPDLYEECRKLGGCEAGEAKITKGYDLPASYVIHTVGPVYGEEGGREKDLLISCYRESLKLAEEYELRSIAFPLLSTGAFGFPKEEAVRIAIDTIEEFLGKEGKYLEKVVIVAFTSSDAEWCERILEE